MTEQEFRGKLTGVFPIDDSHIELVVTMGTTTVRGSYEHPEAKMCFKVDQGLIGSHIILSGTPTYSGHQIICLTDVEYVEDLTY